MRKIRLLFAFALLSFGQRAMGQSFASEGIIYRLLKDSTVAVTKAYNIEFVSIPDSVKHGGSTYAVTAISSHAFYCLYNMRQLKLPRTLRNIAPDAVFNCISLNRIELESNSFPHTDGSIISMTDPETVTVVMPGSCDANIKTPRLWNGMRVICKNGDKRDKKGKH